jgi:murein DD-endopeptidase MepM/ murein hydrolase activator NlpD
MEIGWYISLGKQEVSMLKGLWNLVSPVAWGKRILFFVVALIVVGAAGCWIYTNVSGQLQNFKLPSAPEWPATATLAPGETRVAEETPAPGEGTAVAAASGSSLTPLATGNHIFPVLPVESAKFAENQGLANPAVIIYAPAGSKVVAVTAGTVELVSAEDKYDASAPADETKGGIYVSIIGQDGWRYYYSQMSELGEGLEVGKEVFTGAILGNVGASGNGKGLGPHVYFAISSPNPNDWATRRGTMAPFSLLNAWLNGQNIAPGEAAVELPAPTPPAKAKKAVATEEAPAADQGAAPPETPQARARGGAVKGQGAQMMGQAGKYTFPVSPADQAQFTPNQGLKNPAVIIYAPEGSKVVAVISGTVELVSAEDKYDASSPSDETKGGIYVSIIGEDGLRYYYSQMSSISEGLEVGQSVPGGTELGTVGASGNGSALDPHVYFAVSQPTPDDWATRRGTIPPYNFLNALLRGQGVTPSERGSGPQQPRNPAPGPIGTPQGYRGPSSGSGRST